MKFLERHFKILLFLVALASLALRFYQIGRQSYWLDEMFSVNVVMHNGLSSLFWDKHPFLYHGLLKIWFLLTNPYEGVTRSLSALLSFGTTLYLSLWAKKMFGARVGLLVGLLHALNPLSILYAQETRMYALLEFVSAWQMGSFWSYLEKGSQKKNYFISSLLLGLTHYTAVFIYLLQLILFFLKKKKHIDWLFLGSLFSGTFFILASYLHSFSWKHLDWQKMKYAHEPLSRWPSEVFQAFGFQSWSLFVLLVLLIVSLAWLHRHNPRLPTLALETNGFICFGVFLLITAVSFISQRALFLPRYFIFLAPYWLLIVAATLDAHWIYWQKRKWLPAAMTILLLAAIFPATLRSYQVTKAPWRTLFKIIALSESPVVYTTRTLAIQYPHLVTHNILVKSLELGTAGTEKLLSELSKYKTLWIVENYFGGISYLQPLQEDLQKQGYEVIQITEQDGWSEPVFALKISAPKLAPAEPPKHKKNGAKEKQPEPSKK